MKKQLALFNSIISNLHQLMLRNVCELIEKGTSEANTFIDFDEPITVEMIGDTILEITRVYRDGGLVKMASTGNKIEDTTVNDLTITELQYLFEALVNQLEPEENVQAF